MAPSNYLNQCWLMINGILWHSPYFTGCAQDINCWNGFQKYSCRIIPTSLRANVLTHWGRVTHICIGKLTITGSDNGLSPRRCQAIIWTNADILLIWPLGTMFSEIFIEIQPFSLKKMHLKMSSAKWRPFCVGLDVLRLLEYRFACFFGCNVLMGVLSPLVLCYYCIILSSKNSRGLTNIFY